MSLNKLKIAKFIVSAVVGAGTTKIVKEIIKTHVTQETAADRVTVTVASWVISAVVTERTKKYTDELIDSVVEASTDITGKFKLAAKLGRISRGESSFEQEGLDPSHFRKENGKYVPIPEEEWPTNGVPTAVAEKQPANEV